MKKQLTDIKKMQDRQAINDLSDLLDKMIREVKGSRLEYAAQMSDYKSTAEEHGKASALVQK